MNPLALELNEVLQKQNISLYQMLSKLGKALYFPKGILSQAADAQKKANKYNVTIGIATEGAGPMIFRVSKKLLRKFPLRRAIPMHQEQESFS